MAPQKPSTRRRTIAVWLAVLVALLVLVPWGWRYYQNSRPVEVQIREAINELAYDEDDVPRTRIMHKFGRFLVRTNVRKSESERKRDAVKKLYGIGMQAFPLLMESFDDDRPGYALASISNPTVGLACYYIIKDQLFDFPPGYSTSYYRKGADGEDHRRPGQINQSLFGGSRDGLKDWLKQRKERTLDELQLEVLEWTLAEEERIGVAVDGDEAKYLAPLRRRIEEKRRAIEAQPRR
jgi:hypothetical protein